MLDYDIVMVTDARLPGGTSASVAEEVRAQARAGYRTALLQVDSPLVRGTRALSPRIRGCIERGELDILLDATPVRARLVVARHPTVAASIDLSVAPTITADERLMIANQAAGTPASAAVAAGRAGGAQQAPAAGSDADASAAQAGAQQPGAQGASPGIAEAGALRYDAHRVGQHLGSWLDGPVRWAPIGPLVRDDLARHAPEVDQQPQDWVNVIDVAAWRRPRDGARYRVPVIGRHSRDDVLKWPKDRTDLLAVYPGDPGIEVHVLGGAKPAEQLLNGELPDNWQVHPFGTLEPARFLAGLDVYVYQHHPAWVEAFGRSILEALASGLPTVLGPHFRPLFEDAAVYATTDRTRAAVEELHGDRAHYRAVADRATTFAAERFGHQVHVDRLRELIGPPPATRRVAVAPGKPAAAATSASPGPAATSASPDPAATSVSPGPAATSASPDPAAPAGPDTEVERSRSRVLFVSSNGAGVGHLMRLMSYAKRASEGVEPLFLTFSQGGKVVDDAGYLVEYLASRSISGARSVVWHPMLRARVGELIERYDVRAVVFDGTWPYQGLLDAAIDHPHVQLVWSRRAMWRAGVTNPVLEQERDRFDLVLEPGELAADDDHGATRRFRSEARRVGPVTFLDEDELLSRDDARAALELDPERPAALVHLGAGNIDDGASTLGQVIARLGEEPDLQVRVTRSIIAERDTALPDNVRSLSIYPLARYLPAFDLAVAAPGYNSFHELALAAVPTVFIPNLATSTDDQGARSSFAERAGIGVHLPEPDPASIDAALSRVLDPQIRDRMRERAQARRQEHGAAPAMRAIEELLADGPSGRPTPLELERAAEDRRSGAPSAASLAPVRRTSTVAPVRRTSTVADASGPEDPATPAPEGVAAAAAPTTAPVSLRRQLRRRRKRLQRRVVTLAGRERIRARVRRPFNALPTPARRAIRRRLRRWERKSRRQVAPEFESLPVPRGISAGALVGTRTGTVEPIPVGVVIPATGDPALVDALVERVAQLEAVEGTFAPLIIVSDLAFRAARRHGYLVEYLPPRDRYERLETDQAWADAYRQRLTDLTHWFGLERLVVLPEPEPDTGGERSFAALAAQVAALPRPAEEAASAF